jgi:hypothetical protein
MQLHILQKFFAQHSQPFIRTTMAAVIDSDLAAMVAKSDLRQWRETLALLSRWCACSRDVLICVLFCFAP